MGTLEKIIERLEMLEKKQKDLTDYLGLGKNTFSNWKAGNNQSYKKHIDKIADYLGVTTDYLLSDTERQPMDIVSDWIGLDVSKLSKEDHNEIKRYAEFVANKREQ